MNTLIVKRFKDDENHYIQNDIPTMITVDLRDIVNVEDCNSLAFNNIELSRNLCINDYSCGI